MTILPKQEFFLKPENLPEIVRFHVKISSESTWGQNQTFTNLKFITV